MDLTEIAIIDGFHGCLSGHSSYKTPAWCLFVDLQNLRLPELAKVFGRVGLDDVRGWLMAKSTLKNHCT